MEAESAIRPARRSSVQPVSSLESQATISAEIAALSGAVSQSQPLLDYPPYRSSRLRHPTHLPMAADPEGVELWAPVFGPQDVGPLDADLTMPPEDLPKFYEAVATGHAEFANGVRLVYPMEKHAMQFLNLCANKSFSIIFTWLLGQTVQDTLCGTKVLLRSDYEKIAANRAYFGDFDPFGDFDLLFGADKLNLKIADIPIHYRERTYGSTNIQRWSHGWLLLRMVMFAARKLKFI